MKEGDHVKWTKEGVTKVVGVIVGQCRIGLNKLRWLVLFKGSYCFSEPFAIPESELKLLTPLEALGAQGDDGR